MAKEKTLDQLIREVSQKYQVSAELLAKMIDMERSKLHLQRRRGITKELRLALDAELDIRGDE